MNLFKLTSKQLCCKLTDHLWCAPEIIKQMQLASQKADVYSFGIILYEVIGRQGPFGKGYTYNEDQLEGICMSLAVTKNIVSE